MSTTERAARVLKSLTDEEWKALLALEKSAGTFGTVDSGMVSRLGRIPVERARFATTQLFRKGLSGRRGLSFVITKEGVEALALREYARKDLVAALGAIIAKGKESDVYEAVDDNGALFALKFFKLGRTSFTRVRKKRFLEREMKSWMNVNYEAARREYAALKRLHPLGPAFPQAFASNRSTVLLEQLPGVRLSDRPPLVDPVSSLDEVLSSMRKALLVAGLVNADLSEYNILTDGARTWLIDWPQAVDAGHPNARDYLRHDVASVVRFFRRAYGVERDEDESVSYVRGESDAER